MADMRYKEKSICLRISQLHSILDQLKCSTRFKLSDKWTCMEPLMITCRYYIYPLGVGGVHHIILTNDDRRQFIKKYKNHPPCKCCKCCKL